MVILWLLETVAASSMVVLPSQGGWEIQHREETLEDVLGK